MRAWYEGQLTEKLNEFILYALFIGGQLVDWPQYMHSFKKYRCHRNHFGLMDEHPEMDINTNAAQKILVEKIAFEDIQFSYPTRKV